nr:hypothetical protein [Amycolatopsis nigrescens]
MPPLAPPSPAGPWRRPFSRVDAGVMLVYLSLAVIVFSGLWVQLDGGYLRNSAQDQNMWEWFFAVTAKNVLELNNPFTSDLQNFPLGVNLMANTAMLGVGIPLFPITLTFGPTVTWAVALTGGLAGTAAAWYWVFSRHLVGSRVAAAIGGGFCGFAPSMISHANAHPNFVGLFLLPFIVLRLIRLPGSSRPVRDGVLLGLLVAYQVFLGEEPLLICAVAFFVFAVTYTISRPREIWASVRPMATGFGVAVGVAFVLTAFPLWWQFFGPQSYQSLEHGPVGNDTAALTRFAGESVAGDPANAGDVAMNPTEENAFFGWPLVVLMIVLTIWLWRSVLSRSIAVSMFVLAWLSLGVELVVAHVETGVPGLWKLFAEWPLFESVLESRLAMGCLPAIGALLAIATDRVLAAAASWEVRQLKLPLRLLWLGALTAVLLPIAPTPLEAEIREATPRFFADGGWRGQVEPGGSVVVVPLPSSGDARALHWQVEAGLEFPLADGYFVGPNGPDDKRGRYGAIRRPTTALLAKVRESGAIPQIDEGARTDALDDLRYWRADVVVLPRGKNQDALRDTVDLLLRSPARYVDGVWIWDVRELTR